MDKELINYYVWYLELLLVQSDDDKYNYLVLNGDIKYKTGLCNLLITDIGKGDEALLIHIYLKDNTVNRKKLTINGYWWSLTRKGNENRNLTIKKTLNYLYEQLNKE